MRQRWPHGLFINPLDDHHFQSSALIINIGAKAWTTSPLTLMAMVAAASSHCDLLVASHLGHCHAGSWCIFSIQITSSVFKYKIF
jgi:hypothetical protein